jgi:hypothetical protein
MPPEELDAYKWAMSQEGAVSCTLGYYREMLVAVRGWTPVQSCALR